MENSPDALEIAESLRGQPELAYDLARLLTLCLWKMDEDGLNYFAYCPHLDLVVGSVRRSPSANSNCEWVVWPAGGAEPETGYSSSPSEAQKLVEARLLGFGFHFPGRFAESRPHFY